MRLYVIYDKIAEEAGPIFEAKNDAVAVRNVRQLLAKRPEIRPEEQELVCIGEYNNQVPEISAYEPPQEVSLAEVSYQDNPLEGGK